MSFLIQTSIVLAALYYYPWLGDFDVRARLVLLVPIAAVSSLVLLWFYDLAKAPKELDTILSKDLGKVRAAILDAHTDEEVLRGLSEMYVDGVQTDDPAQWSVRVVAYLHEHFEPETCHAFTAAGISRGEEMNLEQVHSSRLKALDRICLLGFGIRRMNSKLSDLAYRYSNDGPVYLQLLGVDQ